MNIASSAKVRGYYKIEVKNKAGETTRELNSKNLVLDSLIDTLNGGLTSSQEAPEDMIMQYICLGTGTSEPSAGDTALGNEILEKDIYWSTLYLEFSESPDGSKLTETIRRTKDFGLGGVVGNLTEIGIKDYNKVLMTRSLFKDAAGNPTTITVTSEDKLVITYYIELAEVPLSMSGSFQVTDKSGAIVDTVNYEARACGTKHKNNSEKRGGLLSAGVNSQRGWLAGQSVKTYLSTVSKPGGSEWGYGIPAINSASGVAGVPSVIASTNAGPGHHRRFRWNTGQGNLPGGITRIITFKSFDYNPGTWIIHFDKPLMKTASEILEIETSVLWSRI